MPTRKKQQSQRLEAIFLLRLSALSFTLASTAIAAPPANDDFANGTVLNGNTASDSVSNVEATKESNESHHAGDPGGLSVWWKWTAPSDGLLSVSTATSIDEFGAPLDTVLAIYTGSTVDNLTSVASNDQDSTGSGTSFAQALVTSGVSYRIAVDSSASFGDPIGGTINLALTFDGSGNNDHLAARTVLTGTHSSVSATNLGASRESGEATHGGTGVASLWWEWTSPFDGPVTFSTEGSSIDTLMAIYDGSGDSHASLSLIDNDDDSGSNLASLIVLNAEEDKTYFIAVDSKPESVGPIHLCFSQGLPATITAIERMEDGSSKLSITTSATCRLQIEANSSLSNESGWARIPLGRLNDVTGSIQVTDSSSVGQDIRFYRLVLP